MEVDGWCDCMLYWGYRPGRTTAEKRGRLSRQTTSYWSLIIPWRPKGEPYKSLLIKTGPFMDGLMSLGH